MADFARDACQYKPHLGVQGLGQGLGPSGRSGASAQNICFQFTGQPAQKQKEEGPRERCHCHSPCLDAFTTLFPQASAAGPVYFETNATIRTARMHLGLQTAIFGVAVQKTVDCKVRRHPLAQVSEEHDRCQCQATPYRLLLNSNRSANTNLGFNLRGIPPGHGLKLDIFGFSYTVPSGPRLPS